MMDEIAEVEPLAPFRRWLDEAWKGEPNAHAMTLATTTTDGRPSARAVLLKGLDGRGFVFYTNLESRKSKELFGSPHAALCFLWKSLDRQVRVEGFVELATIAHVILERRLRGDRLRRLAAIHRRAVATLRHPLQHRASDPQGLHEPLRLVGG